MEPVFRLASSADDEVCARILYNAFRLNWDMNWWQNLSRPLEPVSEHWDPSNREQLSKAQAARLEFHRSAIRLVRCIGGVIYVACVSSAPEAEEKIAALLCWLPPHTTIPPWSLIQSKLLFAVLRFGLHGTLHFFHFQLSLRKLYATVLPTSGYLSQHSGPFVEIVAASPNHRGTGIAAALLKWQIAQSGQVPVFLDTSGEYQQKVYEKVGFRLLGTRTMNVSGIDERGFTRKGAPATDNTVLRVMAFTSAKTNK